MKLVVSNCVGPVCITFADGARLHDAYRSAFYRGEIVELDFADTRFFVSQFFNAAVGQLLKDHGIDEVRSRLHFLNLPSAAVAPLNRSVENAERYYRDPTFQTALDNVIEARAAASDV